MTRWSSLNEEQPEDILFCLVFVEKRTLLSRLPEQRTVSVMNNHRSHEAEPVLLLCKVRTKEELREKHLGGQLGKGTRSTALRVTSLRRPACHGNTVRAQWCEGLASVTPAADAALRREDPCCAVDKADKDIPLRRSSRENPPACLNCREKTGLFTPLVV